MPAAPLARKEKAMKDNSKFGTCLYIYYKGGVDGEEPVDDHSTGEPIKIVLGAGQVCPGIEDALCDMEVGEEKVVVIPSEEAYGHYQEEGVQTYPRVMFPFGYELKEGDVFTWTNPASGMPIPVRVLEAYESAVKVDFNHPWAEKTLRYWLKVERAVA